MAGVSCWERSFGCQVETGEGWDKGPDEFRGRVEARVRGRYWGTSKKGDPFLFLRLARRRLNFSPWLPPIKAPGEINKTTNKTQPPPPRRQLSPISDSFALGIAWAEICVCD